MNEINILWFGYDWCSMCIWRNDSVFISIVEGKGVDIVRFVYGGRIKNGL